MYGGIYACQNGGTCLNSNGVGVCICLSNGYGGNYCTIPLGCNAGGNQACANGGICNISSGLCACPLGFSGVTCSTRKLSN